MTSPSESQGDPDSAAETSSLGETSIGETSIGETSIEESVPAASSVKRSEVEVGRELVDPPALRTKPNRHFPFLSRHPWVLATALADSPSRVAASPEPLASQTGQLAEATPATQNDEPDRRVELLDHDGNWIARGLVNPKSRLRVRLYSHSRGEAIDEAMFARRIDEAVARRRLTGRLKHVAEGGERLVFSESDRISGLIVDRYADCLSVQFTAAAILPWGPFLIDRVLEAAAKHGSPCQRVVSRIDSATAKHEGLSAEKVAEIESWSRGDEPSGDPESGLVWYRHNELIQSVDLRSGQKTGGYLDQQDNHAAAAAYLTGRRVLDVCTYTGGFALAGAAAGAASVIGVDSSDKALAMAERNAIANSLDQVRFQKGDCFDDLKERGQRGEHFDAVILDPPRFAGSRRQVDAALRAYARLNMAAVDLIPSGGILVTCSCSGHVSRSDFLNMLVDVGRKRQRDLIVLESRGPAPDHPCAVSCPESDYLKCVIAQVV